MTYKWIFIFCVLLFFLWWTIFYNSIYTNQPTQYQFIIGYYLITIVISKEHPLKINITHFK